MNHYLKTVYNNGTGYTLYQTGHYQYSIYNIGLHKVTTVLCMPYERAVKEFNEHIHKGI